MLLGDADVEGARREGLAEKVEAGAGRHGGGDRDDPVVVARLLDQALGEDPGVARRIGRRLGLRAGDDVELVDAVILVGRRLGRRVALALLGHDMDQHRAVAIVADVLQHREQVLEIVAVDRADVVEAKFLEQRAAGDVAARMLDGARDRRGRRACRDRRSASCRNRAARDRCVPDASRAR